MLDTLGRAERVAFVLHDLFAVPFDEIAPIVERSPVAAKKLTSRARRRVHGKAIVAERDLVRQRTVVEGLPRSVAGRHIDGLLAVLAPDVVRRAEPVVLRAGLETEVRGARRLAEETLTNIRRARYARAALVNGVVGAVVAPRGRLALVLQFAIVGDRIAEMNVISSSERLRRWNWPCWTRFGRQRAGEDGIANLSGTTRIPSVICDGQPQYQTSVASLLLGRN